MALRPVRAAATRRTMSSSAKAAPDESFDQLVLVIFTDAMEVHQAVELPLATVRTLLLRDGRNCTVRRILGAPGARDLTEMLKAVVP